MKRIMISIIVIALTSFTGQVFAADTLARHAAIHWKTNNAPGVVIVDGVIKEWPDSLGEIPEEDKIYQWEGEYQDYISAKQDAEVARITAKEKALSDNLPSWAQVETTIDNIGSLAEAKAFLKKLARSVYWLAKDKAE